MEQSVVQRLLAAVSVIVVELAAIGLASLFVYWLAGAMLRALPLPAARREWRALADVKVRKALTTAFGLLTLAVLGANGFLIARGVDPAQYSLSLIASISETAWVTIAGGLARLALAALAIGATTRGLGMTLKTLERSAAGRVQERQVRSRVETFISGLNRAITHIAWVLLAWVATIVLPVPATAANTVALIARVYVIIVVGLVLIRSAALILGALDAMADRYAVRRQWSGHYEHLRALSPTLQACFEYALWIGVASLALAQASPTQPVAAWGPRLMQAIGIFFAGRVLIELGYLEIDRRMLTREGVDDVEYRRRATMVPLVRSAFTYAAYFGTAVLMLGALGFNAMPFLAGAGLLGLVIGFGAQSLINDVVSGFFILFEDIYLVGDVVEVGPAKGVVEAIEFRTTKIRDADGRVHIIRNGDMKPVINYSKDYTMAVVAMEVAYDADLPAVFHGLRSAGERLRKESADLLGDIQIDGITAFGASSMTVRTATRVRPGRHDAVATRLRLLIKESFDQQASDRPRRTLVGERPSTASRP